MTGTNPTVCTIAHRTTAAARRCERTGGGTHPGLAPVPVFGDIPPAEPGCIVMPGDPRHTDRVARAATETPEALPVVPDDAVLHVEAVAGVGATVTVVTDDRAPGEPDEPKRAVAPDATSTHGPKEAIWKSVIGATGGYGCERETFYREVVRDERGYRLRTGADEPIVFGMALDASHGFLMARRLEFGPHDMSTVGIDVSAEGMGEAVTEEGLWEDVGEAVRRGVSVARGRMLSRPWTDEDWKVLTAQLGLACEKLLGLWPNRVKPRMSKGEVVEWLTEPEPEGTPDGPPIAWLDVPGTTTRAQMKLHAPGVVGGRGITGQPDYVFVNGEGSLDAWVDVKALSKAGSYPAKWVAGEAAAYDWMLTVANGGTLPTWHGYLEYRRTQKPYWALITAPVHPSILAVARSYFDRWGVALDTGDPTALAFNPKACGKCHYREPIADRYGQVIHPGCPIGPAVLDIAPPEDDPDAG
jgi:hypothetical protein